MYAGLVVLLLSFLLLNTLIVTAITQSMIDQKATVRKQLRMSVEDIITGSSGR